MNHILTGVIETMCNTINCYILYGSVAHNNKKARWNNNNIEKVIG